MARSIVFVVVVASVAWEARVAHAGCDTTAARRVTLDAYSCMPAIARTPRTTVTLEPKTPAAPGIVVTGAVVGDDANGVSMVWIPPAEKLTCDRLHLDPFPPQTLTGTLERVCCEGASKSEPACQARATAVLTTVTVVAPPSLKRASRAQLEAEIARLRATNARLHLQWHLLETQRLTRELK